MTQAQPDSTTSQHGASKTLGEAAESSRRDYHGGDGASTKGRAGRKDPEVGKSGDKNVQQY